MINEVAIAAALGVSRTPVREAVMIWRAVDISKAQMDRGRHLVIPKPGYGEQTIEQHEAIFEALRHHDAEGAAQAMERHLETSLRNTLEVAADLLG